IFGIDYEHIKVMVHPQSIVHGMVEFEDGSIKMLAGVTDMRLPVHYALFYPKRRKVADRLYLRLDGILSFEEPDLESFPMLSLGYEVGKKGGLLPAAFIGADELAVRAFLEGRIGFLEVFEVVRRTVEQMWDEDRDVSEDAVISMVERSYRVAEDIVMKGDF
ncbi:MAG: 1-deoxy-D-xylulose-5-phosphate reductoisomerase, partial [Synergistetes bacterium]|nr:1-deoxy-D-xylulose-5-phosphate reductoisomerase [Synergistota bacterium]